MILLSSEFVFNLFVEKQNSKLITSDQKLLNTVCGVNLDCFRFMSCLYLKKNNELLNV